MFGFSSSVLVVGVTALSLARAHTVITYPGWRGDNLQTNGTVPAQNPGSRGIDFLANGSLAYPWGMQWIYPCGGMPQTTNRTKWPVDGGAVAVQPGWFPGHSKALVYMNIGIQEPGDLAPPNMSQPVVPPFQILGPTNLEYAGGFCIPQVGMPANLSLSVGQNITLQVIEVAQHGAALYSCVDLTLAENNDPEIEPVTRANCMNDSDISFQLLFTTTNLTATGQISAASSVRGTPTIPGAWAIAALSALALFS